MNIRYTGWLAILFISATAAATAQPFTLATQGCAKAHCTPLDHDAIGMIPPLGGSQTLLGEYAFFSTDGAELSEGCMSDGSLIVCKSDSTSWPHLTAYNFNSVTNNIQMLWNSCTNPLQQPPFTTGCTGGDRLYGNSGPAMVGQLAGTTKVIVADGKHVYRFNGSDGTTDWAASIPTPAKGMQPIGTTLAANGTVVMLEHDGPVVTLDGSSGTAPAVTVYPLDTGTDSYGNYQYVNDNSGCVIGNRVYAATIRVYDVDQWQPSDHGSQYGRLYAIDVSPQNAPAIGWRYDYNPEVSPSVVGPSNASPMCSPVQGDTGIYTDFGSVLPETGVQLGMAGVLGIADCASPTVPPPADCTGSDKTLGYRLRYAELLTTVDPAHTAIANHYINANYAWDPVNSCYWVRVHTWQQMYCLSTMTASGGNPAVVAQIDVGALIATVQGLPNNLYPQSDVTIARVADSQQHPTGDAVAIFGARNPADAQGVVTHTVVGIDTGVCPSGLTHTCLYPNNGTDYFTPDPHVYWYFPDVSALGQFAIAGGPPGAFPPVVAFTDDEAGTYFISSCSVLPPAQACGN